MPSKRAGARTGSRSAARPTVVAETSAPRGGQPAQERELRVQGRKTMQRLLDAGRTVFEKQGFHAARVDDIVKAAKTSHGTFYLYFANKEDLFRALLTDVSDEITSLAQSLGSVTPNAAGYEELRGWLGQFVDVYKRYGPVIRAWTEAEIDDSDFGRLGADVLAGFIAVLIDRVREAAPGEHIDPQIAALAVVAMVERFNYYVLSRRIEVDHDEMIETLASIIHVGLFGGRRGPRAKR
jgi:AcrR family transcriptional regulator